MRIAMMHSAFIERTSAENLALIEKALQMAKASGADLLITPEMAVQGYVWRKREGALADYMKADDERIRRLAQAAATEKIDLLLCGSFLEAGKPRNGCLHITKEGRVAALGSKIKTIRHYTEDWAVPGERLVQTVVNGHTIGMLICADAWYDTHAYLHKQAGAELLVIMAAWPGGCGGPPEMAWCRNNYVTDLPVVVCNQTGTACDFHCEGAQSAYVWDNEVVFSHTKEDVLLFVDVLKDEQPSDWARVISINDVDKDIG